MQSRVIMSSPGTDVVGRVLGRDVRDAAGALVARAGHIVDRSLVQCFRKRGLVRIPVVVSQDSMIPAIREAALTASLDHLFRHWRLSPGMRNLRSVLAEYRLGNDH